MLIEINTHSDKTQTIFAFAYTHGQHRQITVPEGIDTVIFAGDACEAGDHIQLMDFFKWFSSLSVNNKIFVSGNHDLPFEFAPELAEGMVPENIIHLENRGVMINGVHYYSLPVRPWMHNSMCLPSDVDVLVTHGAPKGILDGGFGCDILSEIIKLSRPKNHIFGHVHQTGGQSTKKDCTMFYNVAEKQ
jgi:predicted phosphohydrolase